MSEVLRKESFTAENGRKFFYTIIKCDCGREVSCSGVTTSCECGREYNWNGNLLVSRRLWGGGDYDSGDE